jgi:rubrerythrin
VARSGEPGEVRPLLRIVTPIVWRIPGHGARKLQGFARAEQGSRIDLLQAARLTTSIERRALYLRHAVDETRHAQMFGRRAAELRELEGRAPFGPPHADTEDLFSRLGERRFLAFVHRGEQRGRRQFELYARHFGRRGDARTEALFGAILGDEHRHERYTRELLVELAGGESQARAELRRAAAWEAWRTWRRAGRWLASKLFAIAMAIVYLVAAPITALATIAGRERARRTRRARWQGTVDRRGTVPSEPFATADSGALAKVSTTIEPGDGVPFVNRAPADSRDTVPSHGGS